MDRETFDDSRMLRRYNPFSWHHSSRPPQSSYVRELKSVAPSFGYSPEDVDELISYGFSPFEIEDFFYDQEVSACVF